MESSSSKTLVSELPSSKKSAFRYEVGLDVNEWIRSNKWQRGARCPVTGKRMLRHDAEVDHFPTSFKELMDDFLNFKGIKLEDVKIEFDWKNRRWFLSSRDLARDWSSYHKDNAKMRWASKEGNKKRGDGGYGMITRKRRKDEKEELKDVLQQSMEDIPQTQEIQYDI